MARSVAAAKGEMAGGVAGSTAHAGASRIGIARSVPIVISFVAGAGGL
jgi:hypothetical protein